MHLTYTKIEQCSGSKKKYSISISIENDHGDTFIISKVMSSINPIEKLGDLNLQSLYIKTNEWLDDIDFLGDEIRFFKKILKMYFPHVNPAFALKTEQAEKQLSKLEINKHVIGAEVINHRKVLDLLIKNFISQEEETLRQQHLKLEVKITELNQSFRKFKNDLFGLTEELMADKDAGRKK